MRNEGAKYIKEQADGDQCNARVFGCRPALSAPDAGNQPGAEYAKGSYGVAYQTQAEGCGEFFVQD